MTLSVPHGVITAGAQITVSGRAWPLPGTVTLLRLRTGTTSWATSVASVPLDSTGRFRLLLRPPVTTTYRLLLGNGAVSPWVAVGVGA